MFYNPGFIKVRGASVSFLECDNLMVRNVGSQRFVHMGRAFLVYDDFAQCGFFICRVMVDRKFLIMFDVCL